MVYTDYKNLEHFMSAKVLNRRQIYDLNNININPEGKLCSQFADDSDISVHECMSRIIDPSPTPNIRRSRLSTTSDIKSLIQKNEIGSQRERWGCITNRHTHYMSMAKLREATMYAGRCLFGQCVEAVTSGRSRIS